MSLPLIAGQGNKKLNTFTVNKHEILPLFQHPNEESRTPSDTAEPITPAQIGAAAELIEQASGSEKHSSMPWPDTPKKCGDNRIFSLQVPPASALFKYRSAVPCYQVMAEIKKLICHFWSWVGGAYGSKSDLL